MVNLSQLDLNTYLQLSGCKYGELSNSYANDLKWGMKCSETNLKNLLLLNAYIEILECYNVIGGNKSCALIGIGATLPAIAGEAEPGVNSTISLNVQNILSISMDLSPGSITLQQLVDYINTGVLPIGVIGSRNILVPGIVASLSQNNIILFMPYPEGIAYEGNSIFFSITTPVYDNSLGSNLTEVEGCTLFTEEDNCFKEEEIQLLINNISKLIDICFMPINFDYEIPEGYTLNADGSLTPTEEIN